MPPDQVLIEKRKQQILNAAMKVFAGSGFHAARMDDIAAESGLSKGTIYWYFESKDEIIQTVIDGFFTQELNRVIESLDHELPVKDKLLGAIEVFASDMKQLQDFMPIAIEYISHALREEEPKNRLREYLHNYVDAFMPVFQEGIEKGEIKEINPKDVAITCAAIIEGMILLWMYDPKTINLEKQMISSVKLLIDGLAI